METQFSNDKDLMFLKDCSNEHLKLLVDLLIYDEKNKLRWTEELSQKKSFRENYPDSIKNMLPDIIDELQRFGGNTIRNYFRGHGVSYREILMKVCKSQKVNFNKAISAELLEQYLLQKILLTSVDKMTEEDVRHLSGNKKMTKDILMRNIGRLHFGDPLIIKMITSAIIQIAKKRGLEILGGVAARFAGSRAFAILTGPIGWGISAIWTGYDLAGPAYRVMIPTTIYIAYLRIITSKTDEELDQILN